MRQMRKRRIYECFARFCVIFVVTAFLMLTSAYAATFFPTEAKTAEALENESDAPSETSVFPDVRNEAEESENEESVSEESVQDGTESDNAIPAVNLSQFGLNETPKLKVIDQTGYSPDPYDYLKTPLKTGSVVSGKPTVLIYHTHGTERYSASSSYADGYEYNTLDTDENVVAVGDCLADRLEELGVCAIHDRTMYDADGYTTAYNRSKKAVRELLSAYPSIKYVIDLHRDSVETGGKQAKTVTLFDADCAQVMIVVGSDAGGSSHKTWEDNFTAAVRLQQTMNTLYPTFARPIYLRTASFNQELCAGALLIEVGTCGNTLDEAKAAAGLLAEAMVNTFR